MTPSVASTQAQGERNTFPYAHLIMRAIEDFTIFNGFFCCNPHGQEEDIDDFIRDEAKNHYIDKIAVSYGLFYDGDPQKEYWAKNPLGFATLQNDTIEIHVKGYYPNIPAVKIGRFGISMALQKQYFGSTFLKMIRLYMSQPDNRTGCRYLTLNTYPDPGLIYFYLKNGFYIYNSLTGNPVGNLINMPSSAKQIVMYRDLTSPTFDPIKITREQALETLKTLEEPENHNSLTQSLRAQIQLFWVKVKLQKGDKAQLFVNNPFDQVAAEALVKAISEVEHGDDYKPPAIEIVRTEGRG